MTISAKKRLKRWEIALLIGTAAFLLTGVLALAAQDQLADRVVRLHVLANSDSAADQALKLRVRDVVLDRAEALLSQSEDRTEAEELLRDHLPDFQQVAAAEVTAAGYDYPVSVELEDTRFPTKEYDGFTLPAGEYLALRVLIGAAEGQNWWCVVFPPLCTAASAEVPVAAMEAGLTEEQVGLITEENTGYVLKFKVVEWWETLQGWIDG